MNFARVLTLVVDGLEAAGQPCLVVGGLALQVLGHSRATFDLDVAARTETASAAAELLSKLGYRALYQSSGFANHVHVDPELGRVDFVFVDAPTAQKMFAGAREATLAGHRVRVPKPEHLIAMKVHAMKNDPTRSFKELADVQFLLGLPGVDQTEARGISSEQAYWRNGMSSSNSRDESGAAAEGDALDLDIGLPVTPRDVEALRALTPRLSNDDYLKWVAALPPPSFDELAKRPGPVRVPFRLD